MLYTFGSTPVKEKRGEGVKIIFNFSMLIHIKGIDYLVQLLITKLHQNQMRERGGGVGGEIERESICNIMEFNDIRWDIFLSLVIISSEKINSLSSNRTLNDAFIVMVFTIISPILIKL